MISLRQLRVEDAPLMLEWMHDPAIQKSFRKNMLGMTLEDAERFCASAVIPGLPSDGDSLHWAIVNEEDEYLGTISLKAIDLKSRNAEWAIVTRMCAHGKGVARKATALILKKAFLDYGLHKVYFNVLPGNEACIRLNERFGFKCEGEFRDHLVIDGRFTSLKWYGMLASEYDPDIFAD